jgi:hypothetical protein
MKYKDDISSILLQFSLLSRIRHCSHAVGHPLDAVVRVTEGKREEKWLNVVFKRERRYRC